ncbi:hypothetical protein OSTOST_20837 [Ostertagia ostertagi]
MEYSGDTDAWSWSCIENSMFELDENISRLKGDRSSLCREVNVMISILEPSISLYDDPTYVNLNQTQLNHNTYHFGDRFKGLFLFLRETKARQSLLSSLQKEIEKLLNLHTNCDLATTDEARFFTDIVLFATVIDDRLRRIRRQSDDQFNAIANKLTKIEKKGRAGTFSLLSTFHEFLLRIFTRKPMKN